MPDNDSYNAMLPQRIDIDAGAPGLALTHHVSTTLPEAGDVPADGYWKVTHTASDKTIGRCAIGFRTLHAAAHMAQRIAGLTDWTTAAEGDEALADIVAEVDHAEAHAHEVDATWALGAAIPFSNGPSIIDDTGDTRRFIAQAPYVDWVKDDDGNLTCSACGIRPVHGDTDA